MRNNCNIKIKRSSRTHSEISETGEASSPSASRHLRSNNAEVIENEQEASDLDDNDDDDVVFSDATLITSDMDPTESLEYLEMLQKKIETEKLKTETYMTEVFSYLNSLEDWLF